MEWINELEGKLWRTKGSRFNANKRIAKENQYSRYSMAFLSSYIIIINIYSVYLKCFVADGINNNISNSIPFFSISLGILILVINLTETAKGLNLKAEKMLSSAKEISGLYDRLKLQSSGTPIK